MVIRHTLFLMWLNFFSYDKYYCLKIKCLYSPPEDIDVRN